MRRFGAVKASGSSSSGDREEIPAGMQLRERLVEDGEWDE